MKKPIFKVSFMYVVFDEFMHLLHFTAVMLPILTTPKYFIAGATASFLIDVDHFFAAGSIKIKRLVSMDSRPYTHSVVTAVIVGIGLFFIFNDVFLAYSVGFGVLIHLVRDLIDGKTYVFYPYKGFYRGGIWTYIGFSYFFAFLVYLIYPFLSV